MTREKFEEIFKSEYRLFDGDSVFQGLEIIRKYTPEPKYVVCAAQHDIIYSVGVDDLIENGITEHDVKSLRNLNWMIEEDSMAHFV